MPAKSRPKTDPQLSLALEPAEGPAWTLRPSRRARRLQIRVSPWQGVEVVVPPRVSPRRVQDFVNRNRAWAQRAWEEIRREYPEAGQARLPGLVALPAVQESWRVHYRRGRRAGWQEQPGGLLRVTLAGGELAAHCELLRGWLADRARRALAPRLAALARASGLEYRALHIRGQRTRWGSCTARGIIALNYKLLFCDPPVVRYLLAHELAHTRHLNHGKRFWQLVERLEPDYRRLDAELEDSWKRVPAWVELR